MEKNPLQSKTLWMNILLAIGLRFLPAEHAELASPENVGAVVALANVAMRLFTKGKITLK